MGNRFDLPDLGLGVGLRTVHFGWLEQHRPAVDWFEILSENFLDTRGRPRDVLDDLRGRGYPLAMHGVSMSLGSTDPLDEDHVRRLGALADELGAAWLGDHVCWTGVCGRNGHDLYPLPRTEASLRHLVDRIRRAQDLVGRPLVLENPSTYLTFAEDRIPEGEFIARMALEADCALLLDVNNVYVSCRNHGWDVDRWFEGLPWDRVVQIHLAGHSDLGTHCVDTHDHAVRAEVWALYRLAMERTGGCATLLEWDADIPDFPDLVAHLEPARRIREELGIPSPAPIAAAPAPPSAEEAIAPRGEAIGVAPDLAGCRALAGEAPRA